MFDCFWLSVPVQLIVWKDSTPNDLLCVEWDVKPYTPTHSTPQTDEVWIWREHDSRALTDTSRPSAGRYAGRPLSRSRVCRVLKVVSSFPFSSSFGGLCWLRYSPNSSSRRCVIASVLLVDRSSNHGRVFSIHSSNWTHKPFMLTTLLTFIHPTPRPSNGFNRSASVAIQCQRWLWILNEIRAENERHC